MDNLNGDCIFCKIIMQDIPCHSVYEDTHYLAFLDINPIDRAHTILIPKYHSLNFLELPDEYLNALGGVISKLGTKLLKSTDAVAMNILSNVGSRAGQIIMHAHLHFIPRYDSDEPLGWLSNACDHAKLAELVKKIRET
jgi:histidine triad (HIT) family protein